jgi:hypothetical protein
VPPQPSTPQPSSPEQLLPTATQAPLSQTSPTGQVDPKATLQNELVEVARENIAMLDGNTGHLIVTSSTNELLKPHVTHRSPLHDTILFKTKANCAPDVETAFRLYDECEGVVSMKYRRTINSGVESLRFTRRAITEASRVFFHMPKNEMGQLVVEKDESGCLLLDVYVKKEDNENLELRLLQGIVAEGGHTLPVFGEGHEAIFNSMKEAKRTKVGIFELPDETRKYPFRPCDRRQHVPAPTNIQQTTNESVKMFRMITSPYANESLVYPAPSTINGAGMGLFLRPRTTRVSAGSYLCTYSTSSMEERPSPESGKYCLIIICSRCTCIN